MGYTTGDDGCIQFTTSHGYQLNPYFFFGAGTGVSYFTDSESALIPVFADLRGNFTNGGMSWNQPHRRYIEIDEEYALMTKQTFEGLREYSLTIPSGKYEGKMWKANRGGTWYLYWYDHDDNPEMIKIERREILLLN